MAHPLMFRPFLEYITQQSLEGQSTEVVLLLAQNLTEADVLKAEPQVPEYVRPVKLQAVLEQCAPVTPPANAQNRVSALFCHCNIRPSALQDNVVPVFLLPATSTSLEKQTTQASS